MNWRLIQRFPKYAIVLGVFVISTGLFVLWWLGRSNNPAPGEQLRVPLPDPRREAFDQKVATLPAKMGWLALVGYDLWDVSTGEKLFPNWLRGTPQRLFYQPDTNQLMVQVGRGVIRYGLDGRQDKAMGEESPPAFSHDGKRAMFIRGGDIWLADVDWKEFAFTNERQVTRYGQFYPGYFAANLQLYSKNALVVRNANKLLHVNLKTGDIKECRIPQKHLSKRRSPDGQVMLADEDGKGSLFDVNTMGGTALGNVQQVDDAQWMNNDLCAILHDGGNQVAIHDRRTGKTEATTSLPFRCDKMAGPSPDGRYVLCVGSRGIAVVDLQQKKAADFGPPAQHFGWVSDDTLIYSREVPDTSIRGTWLQTMGEPERQVTVAPYMVAPYMVGLDGGAAVAPMREVGLVVFGTKDALFRMKADGSELRELAALPRPVGRILAVGSWAD